MSGSEAVPGTPGASGPAAPPEREPQKRLVRTLGRTGATLVEWAVVVIGAILLALLVKTFVLQAFYIPSESMATTLETGDRVLVNKLAYTFGDVSRGDVVVFERPPTETTSNIPDLIKRVVGLPGESLVIKNNTVYVDGAALDEPYLAPGTITTTDAAPNKCTDAAPCIVPEGRVWVMGDNRPDSKDSRFFGPIEESTIVGKAFVTIWPLSRLSGL
jgi:signal peptidase I